MYHRYSYYLTLVIVLIITYLTLLYVPSSDNDMAKIPHMDKVVHFCMFFGMSWALAFDYTRIHSGKHYSNKKMFLISLIPTITFGALTEIIQGNFIEARGGDFFDFLADTVGAIIGVYVFLFIFKQPVIRYFSSLREKAQ